MTWSKFFIGLGAILMYVVRWAGRLLNDAFVKPTGSYVHRQLVKWLPITVGVLATYYGLTHYPQLLGPVLLICIMLFGFKVILFGLKPRKKNRRRK